MGQNLESPGLSGRADSTARFSAVVTGPFLVPRLYMDANPDFSCTLEQECIQYSDSFQTRKNQIPIPL